MSVNLSPVAGAAAQFLDNSGNVLTGGKLYTYLAGTTTPAATYTSSTGTTFHSNPIILDAAGRVPNGGEIWLSDNVQYKFVLKDANDVLIGTWDNLVGINSNFVNYTSQEEIQTATAGQTVFNLSTVTYVPSTNSLQVFVDGVNQYDGITYAYVETDATTVTFTAGLHVGALVKFTTAVSVSAGSVNADLVIYDPPFIGGVTTNAEAKFAQTVSFQDFGAGGDGVTDDGVAMQTAIDAVGNAGGGVIEGGGLTYLNETTNLIVNFDNVWIQNANFVRTSATTGYFLSFATAADTNGGGVQNCTFTGVATTVAGNAAVRFGTKDSAGVGYKANKWTLNNVNCTSWAQYGVAIEAGDDWVVSNVKVLEHGLTSGTISSCIGFYVYPKFASQGGQINNVYSQISDACVANASANTAAIKLQTHQRLVASNLTSIYGSESSFVIDSVEGTISNVYVRQQLSDAGLVVGNYNAAHSFSGQTFTLDGFIVEGSGSAPNNEFLIGGGAVGQYKLTSCVIRNGRAGGAGYLNLSNTNSCLFENLSFGDMRFSSAIRGFTVNALPSTNNIYRNITVDSSAGGGTITIETSSSLLANCGGVAQDGDLVGSFVVYGSNNQITNPFVVGGSTNALQIIGDNNEIFNLQATNIVGRSVFFPVGSDNNTCLGGDLYVGTGVSNLGSGNQFSLGFRRIFYETAAPTTGTWARGDVIYNPAPSAGGYIGWVCTLGGTPGTWKQFGAILA